MSEQMQPDAQAQTRELRAFQYSQALDQGDFDQVADILQDAEQDTILEWIILEINEAYSAEVIQSQRQAAISNTLPQKRILAWFKSIWPLNVILASKISWYQRWGRTPLAGGLGLALLVVVCTLFGLMSTNSSFDPSPAMQSEAASRVLNQPAAPATENSTVLRHLSLDIRPFLARNPSADGDAFVQQAQSNASGGRWQVVDRLIIRTGNISLVVEDTRLARISIKALIAEMAAEGAFIVASDEYGGINDASPHLEMTLRVPTDRFDQTMDDLATMALEVEGRSENGQDVTEEYVDLSARLDNLAAARQRLLEIMQAAETTEDLLRAEQQLTQRETEIESLKGRLQFLAQSAQLSSIQVSLRPDQTGQVVRIRWRPRRVASEAFETLISSLQSGINFLIVAVIVFLPWLIIIGGVGYGIRWLLRR